jgi:pimeloyl-ACP methyl ester carboxylesterase
MIPKAIRQRIIACCVAGFVLGCSETSSPPILTAEQKIPANYAHTPVLFIHGSGLSSATWKPMMNYLFSLGYPAEYLKAIDLVPNNGPNVRAATQYIAPAVEALLSQSTLKAQNLGFKGRTPQKVDLVVHSMGAFSSRWYITQMKPERVRTWVAIAGANYGTEAICPFPSDGNNEICPAFATSKQKNPLQVLLNGTPDQPMDPTPYGMGKDGPKIPTIPADATRKILYLTIRIEPDQWINPERSAMIEGAGGWPVKIPTNVPVKETSPGNYLFTARTGHDALPQHPDLLKFVKLLLTERDRPDSQG